MRCSEMAQSHGLLPTDVIEEFMTRPRAEVELIGWPRFVGIDFEHCLSNCRLCTSLTNFINSFEWRLTFYDF